MTIKLSEIAWRESIDVFNKIVNHPFNQEMMNGTLSKDKFSYYMEQDQTYVIDEAKFEYIIANNVAPEYKNNFQQYALASLSYKNEIDLFFETNNITKTGKIAPATLDYTSYALRTTVDEPVEASIACLFVCFKYYLELGKYFASHPVPNNPYQNFIDSYSSEQYSETVDELENIFNDLADQTSVIIKNKMVSSFNICAIYEWHFYNDSYAIRSIEEI